MVLAGLSFSNLSAILKANGYQVESDEFWHHHNRIIYKKANEPVVILQFKEYYGFAFVVTFLTALGIEAPEDCQKPYDQWMEYLKNQRENTPPEK